MRGRLEVALQVDNEWMVDNRKDLLLALHVIDLLEFDNGAFLKALEC